MRFFRTFALSAALLSTAGWAFGQDYHSWQYQDHDRDGRDSREYRDGYNQGRADAQSGRGRHPGSDRREYRDGYEAGYNSARNSGRYQNGGGYGPGGYGPNGGAYGGDINRMAQQNGFRDGTNDGQRDRQTGHSFRPTSMDNYKNAPGYTGTHGSDRDQYKSMYRQSYQQGYQEGYNGGGGRRR